MLTSLPLCNNKYPANTSLAHQLLQSYEHNELQGNKQDWSLDDIKGAAGAVFIAGADTVSLLHNT